MKRILVVDDEMPIRSAAMHILRRAGYQVEAAVDGFEALERLRHAPADAVLLDIKMPLLDGFGFLQAYRADPRLAAAAVVLMSADDQLERRGLEMGGSTFVRKPFAVAELRRKSGVSARRPSKSSLRERLLGCLRLAC